MSLEKAYRQLQEAAGSRPRDQKADVPAQGSTEATAEQNAQPGDAHANRNKDKKGTGHDAVGTAPTEVSDGIGKQPDMKGNFSVQEAEKCDMDDEDDKEDDGKEMDETKKAKSKMVFKEFKLEDELGSLLESADLGDEFKEKAVSIFEAAVNEASKKHFAILEEEAVKILSEEVEAAKAQIDEQVEKYLDYVVQEWIEENKLAVESASRNQVAESFMVGLKDLLEAHYIELPAEKADMYEAEVARSTELATELEEQVNKTIEISKQLDEAQKQLTLEKFVSGMTVVEAEKIRGLAESVEFESAEQFESRLSVLKENYFPENKTNAESLTEDVDGTDKLVTEEKVEKPIGNEMTTYLNTLSTMKRAK